MAEPAIDLNSLKQLSVADRIQLAQDLWDSIVADAPDDAFPISPEIAAELDQRSAEADANPELGRPWDEVRREILERSDSRPPVT